MQTRLRTLGLVIVASLLWTSPTSAATQGAKRQNRAKNLKVNYLGTASWYGIQRQGRKMANGKLFDRRKLTAASWYFPLGTKIRVVNVSNGQSVVVTITDRGPTCTAPDSGSIRSSSGALGLLRRGAYSGVPISTIVVRNSIRGIRRPTGRAGRRKEPRGIRSESNQSSQLTLARIPPAMSGFP